MPYNLRSVYFLPGYAPDILAVAGCIFLAHPLLLMIPGV